MMTEKLFENGRSQAVRLPKEHRFEGEDVSVNKIGDVGMLFPNNSRWSGFMSALDLFTDDFMIDGREELIPEESSSPAGNRPTVVHVCRTVQER